MKKIAGSAKNRENAKKHTRVSMEKVIDAKRERLIRGVILSYIHAYPVKSD